MRVWNAPAMRRWVIGAVCSALLGGCATSTGALPAPAVEASATASSPKSETGERSLRANNSHPDPNPSSHETLDTLARAVPLQCQDGRAFLPLSRERRFEVGVQLSRPNLFGLAVISRWQ